MPESTKSVFDLPVPESVKGITKAETIGELLVPVFDGNYLQEWIFNPAGVALYPGIENKPNNPKKSRSMLYAMEELALGIWGILTVGYHEVKNINRDAAEQDGAAMRLAGDRWIELDWKKARGTLVANPFVVPGEKQLKHDNIDVLLSGQTCRVKCAAYQPLALSIYEILCSETLEKALALREAAITRSGEISREYKRSQGEATEGLNTSQIIAQVISVDGQTTVETDLIKNGEQVYAIAKKNGEFFGRRKFDPTNEATRKYFAHLAKEGHKFQQLPAKK